MKSKILASCILLIGMAVGPAMAAGVSTLESDLRAAETAFAQTMEDRDLEAFASFLDEDTVFSSPRGALRGKEAVVEAWSAFFKGEKAPFSWQPEEVTVEASGTLGLSSGPVLDPTGARVGTFNSVWKLDEDKNWKIIFDRGCPACKCPE